jgi:hypothetical protein
MFGLVKTNLRATNDDLSVTCRTNVSMPTTNEVFFDIYMADKTGKLVFRELGVEYLNGKQFASYLFDISEYASTTLAVTAEIVGNEIRAVFPWADRRRTRQAIPVALEAQRRW